LKLIKNLYGIPICEQPITNEEERIEKYLALRDLQEFLESNQDQEASRILQNR